jgi:DNA primase
MASTDWDLFKEDLRSRCDIADIVGAYVVLKRAGPIFKGLCPFHKERTPSFNVDPRRQMFHCFGCGAGGDVFSFVQQVERTDFRGALEFLARKAGLEDRLPRSGGGASAPAGEREKLFELHERLARHYHELLLSSPEAEPARAYLRERKLDGEITRAWRIGYAPNRFDAILRWGKSQGYETALLITAGVVATRDEAGAARAGEPYDRFRGRVMFPIRDATGRVIAFSGRILDPAASPAKYMNSPETPIFRKSSVLFALDKARDAFFTGKRALLCEGQIDTIRCHAAGFTHAVAAQGTALTEEHVRLLKRYGVDELIFVPDADTAGQRSARRGLDLALRAGLIPRVAVLGNDDDPDTLLLAQGAPALQAALDTALSAVAFAWRDLCATEDARSPAGRLRLGRGMAALLRQAPAGVLREEMTREAAALLGTTPEALAQEALAAPSPSPIDAAPDEPFAPPAAPHPAPDTPADDGVDAALLLELLIHHPTLIDEYAWLLTCLNPTRPGQAAVLRTLLEHPPDRNPDWHHRLPEDDGAARALAAALILHPRKLGVEFGDPASGLGDALMAFARAKLEGRRNRLQADLPQTAPELRGDLENEAARFNLAIATLKQAHRARAWERARPVLEAFAGDL